MLEGLIEKLLLSYLGDYIENLDKKKLSIGVIYFINNNLDMVRKFNIRRYNDQSASD